MGVVRDKRGCAGADLICGVGTAAVGGGGGAAAGGGAGEALSEDVVEERSV